MNILHTNMTRTAALILGLSVAVVAIALAQSPRAEAQSGPVRFIDFGMESEFPEGIRFFAQVESDVPIEDIRVVYDVGVREVTQYNYMDISGESLVDGELFVITNTPERYIPPGAIISYSLEVFVVGGQSHFSDVKEEVLIDTRYEWDTVINGPITVYYHGPVRTRATTIAEKARDALTFMQPVTEAEIETPIALVLYNNYAEMIAAVVPRSTTISRELITEGQAFDDENTVLVLAGSSDIGTATHEITHILVARAANGNTLVPFWLNEGLAEYGNQDQTVDFTLYLEWGVGTGRLPTLVSLASAPGDPDLTLVGYGSGRSAVRFMIEEYGEAKMAELLATIGQGFPIAQAVPRTYGFSYADLEDQWRDSIGADAYVPPTPAPPTATPEATPTSDSVLPFTLDSVAAAGQPTATSEADSSSVQSDGDSASGGMCSSAGPNGRTEASMAFGLLALIGLGVWRTVRRR